LEIKDFFELAREKGIELNEARTRHQYKFLWTYLTNCILGLWLITMPAVVTYKSASLVLSDIVSGVLVILIEAISFSPCRAMVRWLTPIIGCWLLFAPLAFWAPNPVVYHVDTLVGCLLIAFSFLIPGMPGKAGLDLPGPDKPPGWTYNPSSWIRRWLGIALSLVGFLIARYLAAFQLGYIAHAWDPFFGGSSEKVLHSVVSRSFPISDAGFGAMAYILEMISGFLGDRARWRTAPWMVVLFAILVLPLGVTSITLVITQPTIVHHWCGLCLIAAVGLLTSVPLAVHEIIAMGQFLLEAKREGKNFWRVFFMGGTVSGGGQPDPDRRGYSLAQRWVASVQGVTIPWTVAVQLVIGIWLMARPDVMRIGTVWSGDADQFIGALIVTIAMIATAEVTRQVRFLNIICAVLLLIAALAFSRAAPLVLASEIICAIVLAVVSIPKGRMLERYGAWDKYIW